MVISIVIDSDRGHRYEHIKKKYSENWTLDMNLNVCACYAFWAPRNGKRWSFGLFKPNLPQGYFFHIFLCKSSFRVLSKIKIVILDQSKPISLYLKIKKSKIQKSEIRTLHVYYS